MSPLFIFSFELLPLHCNIMGINFYIFWVVFGILMYRLTLTVLCQMFPTGMRMSQLWNFQLKHVQTWSNNCWTTPLHSYFYNTFSMVIQKSEHFSSPNISQLCQTTGILLYVLDNDDPAPLEYSCMAYIFSQFLSIAIFTMHMSVW